jgi:Phage P22-like portal protein
MAELNDEAVDFMRLVMEADTFNRSEGLQDLRFRFGDQWLVQIQQSRNEPSASRPMLVINETDGYCRQAINHIRQQRPRGKCHPKNNTSTVKTAKVMTGIGRHIETHSDASQAYDLAADFAVTIGWGYWRIRNDYLADDSFDQDIYVSQIDNPFGVYYDPYSSLPDGSDAERVLLTDNMPKSEFRRLYPDANDGSGFKESGGGDRVADWINKETIRVGEYIYIDKERAKLVQLSNGAIFYADDMPSAALLESSNLRVVGERQTWKRKVYCAKLTAFEELDRVRLPGRWIPVVPVYGVNVLIDGKRRKFGMVRFARDPQRMVNYWNTNITEILAQAPKAKWLVPAGADEGYENEFANANLSTKAVLHYSPFGLDGQPLPPGHIPQRIQPEAPPMGVIQAAMSASESLQRVVGMFDPVNLKHTGPKSGEAVKQETGQSEQSNFHFYDNLTRSINHTWRIILNWAPEIYDTQRTMRIIGDDNKPSMVTINQQGTDEQGVVRVLNDVRVGDYDVVMETGPGFNTKREEARAFFADLMGVGPLAAQIAKVGADLIVRMVDAEGAEQLADRLAAANPLAQVDENSEVPPRVQMMMMDMKQQLDKAHQLLQQAGLEIKFKQSIEQMRQQGETHREYIRAGVKTHDVETIAATKQHDTEMRAFTMQNVEELRGLVKLLEAHIGVEQFNRDIEQRDRELTAKANESATATSIKGNGAAQ